MVTEFIRRVDEFGRIWIPKLISDALGLKAGQPMELSYDINAGSVTFAKCESGECKQPYFAATRWMIEDVLFAAKNQGVKLTEQEAYDWWQQNERWFHEAIVEHGNTILGDVNFSLYKKGEKDDA